MTTIHTGQSLEVNPAGRPSLKKKKPDAEDRRLLADRYRQACFDLLAAARALREAAELMAPTRVRVSPSALADLNEAWGIMRELDTVKVAEDSAVRRG